MKYSTRKKLFGFCLVLPWIIGFVVFLLYPLSQTILYSFSNVTITPQGTETAPVGFKNYTDVLFTDPDFTLGIPTFLRQMVFMVPMIVVFSLLFALLLNSHIRGQRIYRAIFFLPVILISGPVLERIRQSAGRRFLLRLPIYLQPGPARPLLPDPVYHLQHRADLLVQRRAGPDFSLRAPKGGQFPV